MLNTGQAARRPEGPSMLAAFINLIINNLHQMQEKKNTKQNNPKLKEKSAHT